MNTHINIHIYVFVCTLTVIPITFFILIVIKMIEFKKLKLWNHQHGQPANLSRFTHCSYKTHLILMKRYIIK